MGAESPEHTNTMAAMAAERGDEMSENETSNAKEGAR